MEILKGIQESIINMDETMAVELTRKALEHGINAEKILYDALTPSMDTVGERYEAGDIFIPEMLVSAEALSEAMKLLRPHLSKSGATRLGRVVIGTVAGDIHNIGQEIVSMMLEGAGFEVFNLGVEVPNEKFIEKTNELNADILGMSALLTTTIIRFDEVIAMLKEAGIREKVKVIIGGCIASQKYADAIGADGYGADAIKAVKLAKSLMQK